MNKVCLTGRISNDLEIQKTKSGKSMCEFTLAVKRNFAINTTDFLRCIAWGRTAENLVKYTKKGAKIGLEGSIQVEKFGVDDENMMKRYYIIVGNIDYLVEAPEKDEESTEKEIEDDGDLPF